MTKPQRKINKRGPKPDILVIQGVDWKDAVKHSFQKEKPPKGWPKPKPKNRQSK
jgi:hypothetical protein